MSSGSLRNLPETSNQISKSRGARESITPHQKGESRGTPGTTALSAVALGALRKALGDTLGPEATRTLSATDVADIGLFLLTLHAEALKRPSV